MNTAFNIKLREVEKSISDDSKYISTNEFNKFSAEIYDEILKQAKSTTTNEIKTIEQTAIKS